MDINNHYWSALAQYAKSDATEPPTKLIATADVIAAFEREAINLDGVHVIYCNSDRPTLRIE